MSAGAPSVRNGEGAAAPRHLVPFLLLSAVIWLICLYRQQLIVLNEDVIWLMVGAGRLLDGARFGSELVEVNTPFAVLLHVPAVLMTRWLHLSMPLAHYLATTLIAVGCIGLMALILAPVWRARGVALWLWPLSQAIFLGFCLQAYQFGQRDCLVFLLLLPLIAHLSVLLAGADTSLGRQVAIGVATALALAVKPHYVVVVAVIYGFRLWRFGWRHVLRAGDVRCAVASGLTLVAAAFVFFPDWLEMARFALRFYLPISRGLADLAGEFVALRAPNLAIALIGWLIWWRLPPSVAWRPLITALLVAEPAFLLVYFLQQRGFAYHLIPFELTTNLVGFLAILALLTRRRAGTALASITSLVLAAFAGFTAWALQSYDLSPASMARHPVVVAVQRYDRGNGMFLMDVRGRPALFSVPIFGTQVAARAHCLWSIQALDTLPAEERATYLASVVADFRRYQPDVVVLNRSIVLGEGRDMAAFLSQDPAFAAIWAGYRVMEEFRADDTDFVIYARK